MAEVVLDGLSKTYPGGIEAVRDVSLCLADGELVTVVGASGSGKTTLLRLVAGLEVPTAGEVHIGGRPVTNEPPHARDVAMVFQRPALYPHLRVRENLAFALSLRRSFWGRLVRRLSRAPSHPAVEEVARTLGLADVLDRRPSELSGGQQHRVALGRALVRRPAVFLLDEPLSDLDAPLRQQMRRELHLLQRRLRATMLYVTHDQDEAMTLGDRVVVLDRGRVQQAGPPADLYDRPANRLVAGLLGWPPMNLLEGELADVDGRLAFRHGTAALPVPAEIHQDWRTFAGRCIILGIRPEDVRVGPPGDAGALPAAVRLVERLGPVSLLTLEHGGWTVTARVEGPPPEGAALTASPRLDRAHLFDAATGRALAHPSPGRSDDFRVTSRSAIRPADS